MGNFIKNQFVGSTLNNPVFNYAEKTIPKHLGTLPFYPEVFLGREDDLEHVHRKLFGSENVLLLVNGQGGIGKTTFASKYYHRYVEEYKHMAWVFAEKGLADALLVLAGPLQVSFEETTPAEARLAELLKVMAELKKPCLLVMDNANNLSDLERNYPALRSCPNFHVLLTTRVTDLPQAAFHPLGTLSREKSMQLFCEHYPAHETEEDGLLQQVLKAVGYNTLVIELLAKNFGYFNNKLKKRYPLAQLLGDLTEKGLFGIPAQEVSTFYHANDLHLRKETPEAIISAMYDLGELQKDERKILSIMSVLPAERIAYGVLEDIHSEMEDFDRLLLGLSARGWLEFNQGSHAFKISPVVQYVVRHKNRDLLWEDCRPLVSKLRNKLHFEPNTGHLLNTIYEKAKIWATYAEYAGNILMPWFENHPAEEDNFALLFDGLGSFHRAIGDLPKALFFFKKCEVLFTKLTNAYPRNMSFKFYQAMAYERLGDTYRDLGDLRKALEFFEECSLISKNLYSSNPQNANFKFGLAISFQYLGDTYHLLGKLEKALGFFVEFSRIIKELYTSDRQNVVFKNGLAISYLKLGDSNSSLGNLEATLRYYKKYNHLEEELTFAYPHNLSYKKDLAISYQRLGDTYKSFGDLKVALRHFEQYNNLMRVLHSSHPQNVSFKNVFAISYQSIGNTYSSLGNLKEALSYYEQYNNLIQELYSSHPLNVMFKYSLSVSYSKLGEIHTSMVNLEKALWYFEQYHKLAHELYSADPQNVKYKVGTVISYQLLGHFYEKNLNEKSKALVYYFQAKSLCSELHTASPTFEEFRTRLIWIEDALKRLE